MNNLDILKKELIAQKKEIEGRGGVVNVANLNPSPSEITAGIKTIESPNLTYSTAQEEDVVVGKTFYSGNNSLKTGKLDLEGIIYNTFLYSSTAATTASDVNFTFRAGETKIREYAFYKCKNPLRLTLNEEMEKIETYAFNNCSDVDIVNFSSCESLKQVADYSFTYVETMHKYLSCLPPNLQIIGNRAFGDVAMDGDSIYVPESVTVLGSFAFARNSVRKALVDLRLPSNYSGAMPSNLLTLLSFDCDITLPENVTELNNSFNYRGSFNNVTIPVQCTRFRDTCFGASSTDPDSNFHMKTITFESETPLTFGKNVIATQHLNNGLKIYVPDVAVEYYKVVSNFSQYANYIYPMSQKE